MKRVSHILLFCLATALPNMSSMAIAGTAADDYELQERCGKRAQEVFDKNTPTPNKEDADGQLISTYSNHYNKKLNKCFFLITVNYLSKNKAKSVSYTQVQLYDLNENKEYGVIFAQIDSLMPLAYTPLQCTFLAANCRSMEEWNSLQKPYMEE